MSAVVGAVTLFMGASGVFGELQSSLNTIWGEVEPKPGRGLPEEPAHYGDGDGEQGARGEQSVVRERGGEAEALSSKRSRPVSLITA